jgi:diguanylate cyclase (GGDEF)-like protein/PAS domain S-box-containing protein
MEDVIMINLRPKKLSTSFLYPILLTVFIILTLLTIYDAFRNKEHFINMLNVNANQLLVITSAATVDAFWNYNEVSLIKIGDELSEYPEIAMINILDENDMVVYQVLKNGKAYQSKDLYPTFIREVYKDDIKMGELHLRLTTYYLDKEINESIIRGIARTIIVTFCILLLILVLSRNITASIDNVAEGVKAFANGDRKNRIIVMDNHEIEQLANRINHMFDVIVETDIKLKENYLTLQSKEETLRITEERYRYAVEGSNDAVWDWNFITDEYYVSARGAQMIGLSDYEEINLPLWSSFIHPQDKIQFEYFMDGFRQNPDSYRQVQFRMIGSNGDIHWLFCRGKGILDFNKQLIRVSGFYTDITERVKAEEAINHLAYYDVLTGLPNRAMLFEHINKIFNEPHYSSSSGALMFMDLDDFKTINDTKGHSVGDQVLVSIAKELENGILCDAIARIGGDEFVIVKKNCDINQVSNLSNDIINIIRTPRIINGYEFNLSCSMGIALFPEDGTEVETLLMKADSAMYEAKLQGKDQFKFYEQSINDQMIKKIQLQNEIRQGILNREFILYYQPQVDMVTGRVIGVEALVRWQHPVQGLLSPIHFIGLAEETGLIIPLGEYILKTACQQSAEWEKTGYKDIMMSVNISAKQINKKNIVKDIVRIIKEEKMKPELLILEITESIAMENIEHTIEVMNSLKKKGITFSLDDFGTGYSSLNYLKNIPIDHVKIDKQFVQSLQKQMFEELVVKAIIEIAHSMKLVVVAEGIETPEQRETLIKYQCDLAQGYYFSRPIPKQEVEAILMDCLPKGDK